MPRAFQDLTPLHIEESERQGKTPILEGTLFIAKNGVHVMYLTTDQAAAGDDNDTLIAIKGNTMLRREFAGKIPDSWMARRINAFGDYVKETKLPRGPRKKAA